MFFYLNYSKVDIYDELAHISYVAYLEENDNVIIPKFSDIKILMKYNEEEKQQAKENLQKNIKAGEDLLAMLEASISEYDNSDSIDEEYTPRHR